MIDFNLSDSHLMLKESIREFVDREIIPIVQDYDQQHKFLPPLKRMGELGYLGICIPKKYGGSGLDYLSLALMCEELERGDSSLRIVISVHLGLTCLALLQWGTFKQKATLLTSLAKGEKIATFGLTEPKSGSDVAALQTKAKKSGDEYIISGQKTWISLAAIADQFLIIARLDNEKRGTRNLAAFLIDRDYPGVSTDTIHNKLGLWSVNTGQIKLDEVVVPENRMIGREGEGFKIAMSALDNGRFTVAAGAVGLIRACLEKSTKYATTRTAFGKDIGQFQLIQEHFAEMQAAYDISQLLVYKVAWLKNIGKRNTRETSMAKWVSTNYALDAANRAIQIHGANGYSADFSIERFWRNARSALIYEGTNEIQKLIQSSYVLGYRKDKKLRCNLPAYDISVDSR
ncbi:MAG: acyl-CoA dehydrogenase family protein [Candidatus Hodarchaeales archaeon]